tara:strand:+ start:2319 stop:3701 length:1383 start_codon:yes stop_codon:yes gene_type:complete
MKKKSFLILASISLISIFLICIASFWIIVSSGYDKQNKIILNIKKIFPSHIAKQVRDKIFFIPNLQARNKFLSLQVEKYEQGLEGKLFNSKIFISQKDKKKYLLKEFFLPFPRLDTRLGWAATENSKRAHYLEILQDKVFVISGLGETIYFNKKNIKEKKLNQKKIKNNINDILKKNEAELMGIRDLYYDDNFFYISMQHKDKEGFTVNVYRAKVDYLELKFELFFKTGEYWPSYNVFSGGRLEKFKEGKILFSTGFSKKYEAPQNKSSLLGKIISIDKKTKNYELISYGHRNPQGLHYLSTHNIIINTEHGPKGGDEINFNFLKSNEPSNFGWPVSSYGSPYSGEEKIFEEQGWLTKSHDENGFKEPIKHYTPSIGISELVYLPKRISPDGKEYLFVSSLRAASIYVIKLNNKLDKILDEDRVYFPNHRIRDIEYDEELGVFFILFEHTPSVGILHFKT